MNGKEEKTERCEGEIAGERRGRDVMRATARRGRCTSNGGRGVNEEK